MGFATDYYRGHDVLLEMPNAHGTRDEQETVRVDMLDNGIGQVALDRVAVPTLGRPWLFTLTSRADLTSFLAWCTRRRGAYKELWIPTWRRDFQLVGNQDAGDTDLVTYATGYPDTSFASEARRHLAIMTQGAGVRTLTLRRITAAVDNGDGTQTITIETAAGIALDPFAQLSFLVLARLESDDIPIQYFHLGLQEVAVRFVELPRQVERSAS